ncbi:hypothetical protein [Paenibacillus hamazuiensis]|uniref:hypothetical protein n=1 Tax=Paenibacillus hamazuiensis TaxID=2936508 RepID=UPI00200D5F82|nr:hypothetical protein [Paenibacillus hamazuiensis]
MAFFGRGPAWLARLKKRTFFIKMMLATAFISIIPNLLTGVVSYYNVSKTFEQETGETKLQYLNQTINAMEIVVGRIKENANLLVMNQSVQDFEQFPNGSYYEGMQGEFAKEDLPFLYEYLTTKKTLCKRSTRSACPTNSWTPSTFTTAGKISSSLRKATAPTGNFRSKHFTIRIGATRLPKREKIRCSWRRVRQSSTIRRKKTCRRSSTNRTAEKMQSSSTWTLPRYTVKSSTN